MSSPWIAVLAAGVGLFGAAPAEAQWAPERAFADPVPASEVTSRPERLQQCVRGNPLATAALQVTTGMFGGGVFGAGTGLGLLLLSGVESANRGGEPRILTPDVLMWGSIVGYFAGSAVTVQAVGRARGHDGDFLPTLAGSVVGAGSPGATIGYHLTDTAPRCDAAPPPSAPPGGVTLLRIRF